MKHLNIQNSSSHESIFKNDTPIKKRTQDSVLIVFQHIKQSLTPAQLWKENKLTRGQVDYALDVLKRAGFIEKISYGVWKVLVNEISEKRTQDSVMRTPHVAQLHTPAEYRKPDSVRAHGMVMTLSIPKIEDWKKKAEILNKVNEKTGQPFMRYKSIPQGQRIFFEGCKIWLCKDSIVIYYPKNHSWYAKTAPEAVQAIIYDTLAIIRKLERTLRVGGNGFRIGKGYKVRFSRNHYSLIRNALAAQYKDEKKKLFVYDDNGLWMTIDNSFNLLEAETLHPETAVDDNVKVQNFFNGVKHTGITPEFILKQNKVFQDEMLANRQDLVVYGKEISAHKESIKQLGRGVEILTTTFANTMTKLTKVIEKLDGKLNSVNENTEIFTKDVNDNKISEKMTQKTLSVWF